MKIIKFIYSKTIFDMKNFILFILFITLISCNASKNMVETEPIPAGGMQGWSNYLSENLRYPTDARRKGIEGKVMVAFVVNKDGTVSDIEILQGIGGGCDEEAIRIVKESPKWEPGIVRGKAVRTRMRLPLNFELEGETSEGDSTTLVADSKFPILWMR
jgi:TonB family protein